jgi:hypothetical protein
MKTESPMSTPTHTPGPWSVVEYTASDAIVVHADHEPDGEICLVSRQDPQSDGGRSKAVELANARLIASAPALKESNRELEDLLTLALPSVEESEQFDKPHGPKLSGKIRAALSKAKLLTS